MKNTPGKVMERLAGIAYTSRFTSSSLRPKRGKPGEMLQYMMEHRLTAEERDAIKNLTAADLQNCTRPEIFCLFDEPVWTPTFENYRKMLKPKEPFLPR